MTTKTYAFWDISLDCECPNCQDDVDLLDASDFWEGRFFDICEHHTDRTLGVKVICPECNHKFGVDLEY